MTASNIPDSFSPEALQELLESAPTDIVDREVDDETCSSCELHERVTAALEAFEEVAEDALTAKAGVMSILDRMVEWHTTVAQSLIERGETEAAKMEAVSATVNKMLTKFESRIDGKLKGVANES